jgi:O-antigen/teichoic acid export membrane protein
MVIPFYIIINWFGPELFAWFFGSAWKISGVYATYLVLFFSISFITSPLGQVLIALKQFKVNAAWQIGKFILIYLLIFVNYKSIFSFLQTYNLIGTFIYGVYGLIVFYYAYKYDTRIK